MSGPQGQTGAAGPYGCQIGTAARSHAEGSGHAHGHASRSSARLLWALLLTAVYMIAEACGGYFANSLALLADAGHMLADVAALGLTLFTFWFARRPATARHTYGYYRAEILAALVNGGTLLAISFYIFFDAIARLRQPPQVQGQVLMGIAGGGLAVNLLSLWLLHSGREQSLNVRGAWLHVLMDLMGSIGAVTAGALVWALHWEWADPAMSILIGLLVVYSSWSLLKQSATILMEAAPAGVNVDEVRDAMRSMPGVDAVHDLHIWTISTGINSLSAHVIAPDQAQHGAILRALQALLGERFGIRHVTIQIELREVIEGEAHRAAGAAGLPGELRS